MESMPSPAVQATASSIAPVVGMSASILPSATAQVTPSGNGRQLVYALGKLNYDFGTEANRDWFSQRGKAFAKDHDHMKGFDPDNPADMLGFIGENLAYFHRGDGKPANPSPSLLCAKPDLDA